MGSTFNRTCDEEFLKPVSPNFKMNTEKPSATNTNFNYLALSDLTSDLIRSDKISMTRCENELKPSSTQSPLEVMAQRFGEVVKGFQFGQPNLNDQTNSMYPNATNADDQQDDDPDTDARSTNLIQKSMPSWNSHLPLFLTSSSLSYFQNCLSETEKQWNTNMDRTGDGRDDLTFSNLPLTSVGSSSTGFNALFPCNLGEYQVDKNGTNDTPRKSEFSDRTSVSPILYSSKSSYLSLPSIFPLAHINQPESLQHRPDFQSINSSTQSDLSTNHLSPPTSSAASSFKIKSNYGSLVKPSETRNPLKTADTIQEYPSPSLELLRKQTSRLYSNCSPSQDKTESHSLNYLTHYPSLKSVFKDQCDQIRRKEFGTSSIQSQNPKLDYLGHAVRTDLPPTPTVSNQTATTLSDLNHKTMSYYWSHDCSDSNIKPPFSYITLIVSAMSSKPSKKITLNEIYAWIMSTFAYYRKNTRRWQNSIRHALSFNDCFIKVPRPTGEAGKGSYWTVHPRAMDMFDNGSSMRRNRKFIDENRLRHTMGSRKLGLSRLRMANKSDSKDELKSTRDRVKMLSTNSYSLETSPNVKSEVSSPERMGGTYFDDHNLMSTYADPNEGSWRSSGWNVNSTSLNTTQNDQPNSTHLDSHYLFGYSGHSTEASYQSLNWHPQSQHHNSPYQYHLHNSHHPHNHHHHHHHHPQHHSQHQHPQDPGQQVSHYSTNSPRQFSLADLNHSDLLKPTTDRTPGCIKPLPSYSFAHDLNGFDTTQPHWLFYDQDHKLYV